MRSCPDSGVEDDFTTGLDMQQMDSHPSPNLHSHDTSETPFIIHNNVYNELCTVHFPEFNCRQ